MAAAHARTHLPSDYLSGGGGSLLLLQSLRDEVRRRRLRGDDFMIRVTQFGRRDLGRLNPAH